MLLINGNVLTMDPERPRAQVVRIDGDRIAAVGGNAVTGHGGDAGEVIDLEGRTLIPGFNDAHCHLLYAGQTMLDVDLAPDVTPDIATLKGRLADRARVTPPGEWIVGYHYDMSKLAENRHPTRHDLDAATSDHPVLIHHVCSHVAVANSAALARMGFTRDSKDPAGGRLGRDHETGELDGRLYEVAVADSPNVGTASGKGTGYPDVKVPGTFSGPPAKTMEDNARALETIARKALSLGITCATDASLKPASAALCRAMAAEGSLPFRLRGLARMGHVSDFDAGDFEGTDWFRIIGGKVFADGAIAGRTACLVEPYEGTDDRGILCLEPEALNAIVREVHDAGLQACIHANGDRAIGLALDAIEAAMAANPRPDPRHRLEHGTVMTPDLIARTKRLGVVVLPFASYIWHHGEKMASYGRRIEMMFACRSLTDAGVVVAGSTDHPCAPLEPLLGVQSMVLREGRDGQPLGPSQRVSVEEALRIYTVGSAWASFEERHLGAIRPGFLADLAVLDADPTAVDPHTIKDIPVSMTVVGGRVVYSA